LLIIFTGKNGLLGGVVVSVLATGP
jgi:hypothetical protein